MNIEVFTASETFPQNYVSHYWQNKKWEQVKQDSGCETFWAKSGNAKALVIVRKAHWLKFWIKPLWEIPRGPIGDAKDFPALLQEIINSAKKKNISTVRVYPPFGTAHFWENNLFTDFLEKNKNTISPEIFPCHTLFLDLSVSEEDILAQMKQKGRYNIKLARKKGVKIIEENTIENFWSLMKTTSTRDGFRSCKKHVYNDMLKSFGNDSILLTAKDDTGEILASAIFSIIDGMAIYNYGASSNKKRNLMAPYLLQWAGIQWAKKKGATLYDFLGISPENDTTHNLATVAGFKLKFGGTRITCDSGRDFIIQ